MAKGLLMVCDVDLAVPDATRVHTLEVARGFAAEGFDVDLVARGPDPRVDGVRYWQAHADEHAPVSRLVRINALLVRLLVSRRRSASRFYVRDRWSLMPAVLVARVLRYRIVIQVDDVAYGRGYELEISPVADYVQRLSTAIAGRLSRGVVAVTPELKGLLVDEFRVPAERIVVLPNGVDVDFFRPIPREEAIHRLGLDPSLKYVVFCGNFAPWVDFDTILRGFEVVARKCREARLLLVGAGSELERVEQLAYDLQIADAMVLTGYVADRARVRDYVAAATIALTANRVEYRARIGVSPVKLAEYLAAGRAIVATDLPGLRDTLEAGGAGMVVPVDPGRMGEAILTLLEPHKADQLGVKGRRLAEERFSWRTIVQRTVPLFER